MGLASLQDGRVAAGWRAHLFLSSSALLAIALVLLLRDRLLHGWLLGLAGGSAAPLGTLPPCTLDLLSGQLSDGSASWTSSRSDEGRPPFMAMPKLALSDCRLRRFTAEEARTCLAGRPVVFVGDSLSRYSFLSLAAFLHNGSWPALTDCPNILHKHTWAISLQGYFQSEPLLVLPTCF